MRCGRSRFNQRDAPGGNVDTIPWAALGHRDFATAMVVDPARGGLWLGFWDGGIGHFQNGQMRATYSAAEGLGNGRVNYLGFDRTGALWAASYFFWRRLQAR